MGFIGNIAGKLKDGAKAVANKADVIANELNDRAEAAVYHTGPLVVAKSIKRNLEETKPEDTTSWQEELAANPIDSLVGVLRIGAGFRYHIRPETIDDTEKDIRNKGLSTPDDFETYAHFLKNEALSTFVEGFAHLYRQVSHNLEQRQEGLTYKLGHSPLVSGVANLYRMVNPSHNQEQAGLMGTLRQYRLATGTFAALVGLTIGVALSRNNNTKPDLENILTSEPQVVRMADEYADKASLAVQQLSNQEVQQEQLQKYARTYIARGNITKKETLIVVEDPLAPKGSTAYQRVSGTGTWRIAVKGNSVSFFENGEYHPYGEYTRNSMVIEPIVETSHADQRVMVVELPGKTYITSIPQQKEAISQQELTPVSHREQSLAIPTAESSATKYNTRQATQPTPTSRLGSFFSRFKRSSPIDEEQGTSPVYQRKEETPTTALSQSQAAYSRPIAQSPGEQYTPPILDLSATDRGLGRQHTPISLEAAVQPPVDSSIVYRRNKSPEPTSGQKKPLRTRGASIPIGEGEVPLPNYKKVEVPTTGLTPTPYNAPLIPSGLEASVRTQYTPTITNKPEVHSQASTSNQTPALPPKVYRGNTENQEHAQRSLEGTVQTPEASTASDRGEVPQPTKKDVPEQGAPPIYSSVPAPKPVKDSGSQTDDRTLVEILDLQLDVRWPSNKQEEYFRMKAEAYKRGGEEFREMYSSHFANPNTSFYEEWESISGQTPKQLVPSMQGLIERARSLYDGYRDQKLSIEGALTKTYEALKTSHPAFMNNPSFDHWIVAELVLLRRALEDSIESGETNNPNSGSQGSAPTESKTPPVSYRVDVHLQGENNDSVDASLTVKIDSNTDHTGNVNTTPTVGYYHPTKPLTPTQRSNLAAARIWDHYNQFSRDKISFQMYLEATGGSAISAYLNGFDENVREQMARITALFAVRDYVWGMEKENYSQNSALERTVKLHLTPKGIDLDPEGAVSLLIYGMRVLGWDSERVDKYTKNAITGGHTILGNYQTDQPVIGQPAAVQGQRVA